MFISPGLYRNEKKYIWPFVLLTSGLFISGGFFAYKLAFPKALAFLIGGPDGLDAALKKAAAMQLRLSGMTLPHGLARVLLAEQLYRALSVIGGHPYHRE